MGESAVLARWPVISVRRLAVVGLVLIAAVAVGRGNPTAPSAATTRAHATSSVSLPVAAQGPISAVLGRNDRAYWIQGARAVNPAQSLRLRFSSSGVTVASGRGYVRLGVIGAAPVVRANRVSYARGGVREWFVNGPFGLEQGFTVEHRVGEGANVTLRASLAGDLTPALRKGSVVLRGHGVTLRYTGLVATDATGRRLPASLSLSRGGSLRVSVDARGARYPLTVDPMIQQLATLTNGDTSADVFGSAVAISGGTIAVGAPLESVGGTTDAGAVYVFSEPAAGWANVGPPAVLTASSPTQAAELGFSVAIVGNTIVSGAASATVNMAGSVYVFTTASGTWSTGTQTAILTDGASDDLGASVAISPDRGTIAAGAPGSDAVDVYTRPGNAWVSTASPGATLTASNTNGTEGIGNGIGDAVSMTDTTVVAGADTQSTPTGDGGGAVYLWAKPSGGNWTTTHAPTSELFSTDSKATTIGWSVATDATTVVAGAPESTIGGPTEQGVVELWTEPSTGWPAADSNSIELSVANSTFFGGALSLSSGVLAVGAYGGQQGSVDLFHEPASGWAPTTTASGQLTPPASNPVGAAFGWAVGVDNGTVVVGEPRYLVSGVRHGEAFVFGSQGGTGAPTAVPANTTPPAITGTVKAGRTLTGTHGTWSNNPNGYSYQWSRDGTPVQGSNSSTYRVQMSDEGLQLSVTVIASNALGAGPPATSSGVLVAVPKVKGCPAATGKLSGTTMGLVRLGMTRAQARRSYTKSSNRGARYEDFFCLTPRGVRVGYASPKLLATLKPSRRHALTGRVIWASTAYAFYNIHGIRPGALLTTAQHTLHTGPVFHIGLNDWYLAPNGNSTAVLKVRHGIVEEIGIGDKRLTRTRKAQRAFLTSFS